jgi:hypothetical protein
MKLLEENINDPPMTKFQRYGLATFFTMMAGPVGLFVAVDWEKDRTSAQQRYEVFASKI